MKINVILNQVDLAFSTIKCSTSFGSVMSSPCFTHDVSSIVNWSCAPPMKNLCLFESLDCIWAIKDWNSTFSFSTSTITDDVFEISHICYLGISFRLGFLFKGNYLGISITLVFYIALSLGLNTKGS